MNLLPIVQLPRQQIGGPVPNDMVITTIQCHHLSLMIRTNKIGNTEIILLLLALSCSPIDLLDMW